MARQQKTTQDQRQRLLKQITDLNTLWDLLQEKLIALKAEKIQETRSDEVLRIEAKIKKMLAEQKKVERALKRSEAQLAKLKTDKQSTTNDDHTAKPQPIPNIPNQQKVIQKVRTKITELFAKPKLRDFHNALLSKHAESDKIKQFVDCILPLKQPLDIPEAIETLRIDTRDYLNRSSHDPATGLEIVRTMNSVLGWLIVLTVSEQWVRDNAENVDNWLNQSHISISLQNETAVEVVFARLRAHAAKFEMDQDRVHFKSPDQVRIDDHFETGFLAVDRLPEIQKAIWKKVFKSEPKNIKDLEAQLKHTLRSRSRDGEHYHIVVPLERNQPVNVKLLNQLSRQLPHLGVFLIGGDSGEPVLTIEEPEFMVLVREFLLMLQKYQNEHA